ncbi:hypothetical protein [Marinobacter sp. LN3S78]|uniref:hypothetical protein n=1 Tax=Marinobacter sp. LN3S78 TaxID=3382300 RepID=UPI00387B127F
MKEFMEYPDSAYRSYRDQEKANRESKYKDPWYQRGYGTTKLLWGKTRNVIPSHFLLFKTPEDLRDPNSGTDLDLGIIHESCFDHRRIRYSPYHFRVISAAYLETFGGVIFQFATPLFLVVNVLLTWYMSDSWSDFYDISLEVWPLYFGFVVLPLLMWHWSTLILKVFPDWFSKKGRGPEWEINRETGMVKTWKYPSLFFWREPRVVENPFIHYEASCGVGGGEFAVWHGFYFRHRETGDRVDLGAIFGIQTEYKQCEAFWDFIQNYMDVTQPLPDAPFLEEFRDQDPKTKEYDRMVKRKPNYWRNMDMKTFEQKVQAMERKIDPYRREVMEPERTGKRPLF